MLIVTNTQDFRFVIDSNGANKFIKSRFNISVPSTTVVSRDVKTITVGYYHKALFECKCQPKSFLIQFVKLLHFLFDWLCLALLCLALPSYLHISISRQRLKNDCLLFKLHIMSKTEIRHFGMQWNTVPNDTTTFLSIKITIWIGIMMLASFISIWCIAEIVRRTQVEMSFLLRGGLN